jgi:hypothetical protein
MVEDMTVAAYFDAQSQSWPENGLDGRQEFANMLEQTTGRLTEMSFHTVWGQLDVAEDP